MSLPNPEGMEVRDATEADAPAVADLLGVPEESARDLVHDRTTRVADESDTLRGAVSFDAREGVVHVTGFGGDADALGRLLDEPLAFADHESLPVEVLLTDDDGTMRDAVETKGFSERCPGPRFEGRETTRYRRDA